MSDSLSSAYRDDALARHARDWPESLGIEAELQRRQKYPGARLCRGDQPQQLRNEWRVESCNTVRRADVLRLIPRGAGHSPRSGGGDYFGG